MDTTMIEEAGKMAMYLYKGYWIKKGPFGWYAVPVDKVAHANEERSEEHTSELQSQR